MQTKRTPAALLATALALSALAQPTHRCQLPEAGLPELDKAERLCNAITPALRSQCSDFLDELASIEDISLAQALALAFGRAAAARREDVDSAIAEANLAGQQLLKPFVDAAPEDPMLLRAYAFFHSGDMYRELMDRVLVLEPTCSAAALELAFVEDDEDQEAKYVAHGYEHSEGMWKLLFASWRYGRFALEGGAEEFRAQVSADMGSPYMLLEFDMPEIVFALVRQQEFLDSTFPQVGPGFREELLGSDDEDNWLTDEYLIDYEHSEGTWEMLVALLKHRVLLYDFFGDQPEDLPLDQAEQFSAQLAADFRAQVAADMESRHMPLDAENRAESLRVLCNGNALKLRLEARCEEAVEHLAATDRLANVPLGADVLEAIGFLNGAAEDGDFGDEGARHHKRWRQLLEAELEEHRSAEFHVVYSRALRPTAGVEAEAKALRRALELDPHSGEIGLYLSGALKRAGRPAREIKDVYRHVIANADHRSTREKMAADYYAARAAQLLRELEGEGSPQAANEKARP